MIDCSDPGQGSGRQVQFVGGGFFVRYTLGYYGKDDIKILAKSFNLTFKRTKIKLTGG